MNELLDLTHLAKGTVQLNLGPVDAHEAIGFILKNHESEQRSKQIGVDLWLLAQHSCIHADAPKLEQVLSNLIGNAIKFTAKGGKVSIVTRNEGGTTLVIEVSDTGIGIPPDALARIFSPFEQADASIHSRFGGLGLGLSIAHTLVDAQGGTLEAASEGLNRGAKFTARFRLGAEPPEEIPVVRGAAVFPGLRILLVEDEEDVRACVHTLLESRGYDVKAVGTVQGALELGARHHFDLLIADVGLPDGTGRQLLFKLQSPFSGAARNCDQWLRLAGGPGPISKGWILFAPGETSSVPRPPKSIEAIIPEARAASLRQLRE